jgi:SAM-dependent methyltransferase
MTDRAADTIAQVLHLFDNKAATWSAKYAQGGRLTGRLQQLLSVIQQHSAVCWPVLDLGCGTGELASAMAESGLSVTGCDISSEMLRQAANAHGASDIQWTPLDPTWQALPFADATFGTIVASSVLEYVHDPAAVLAECARILRPHGLLIFTVPNNRHPFRWVERLARILIHVTFLQDTANQPTRFSSYLQYLQVSKQRLSIRGWAAIARRSGLYALSLAPGEANHKPLRLLAFERSAAIKESQ